MRILVISSCTSKKNKLDGSPSLTAKELSSGDSVLTSAHKKNARYLQSAEDLYSGEQHVRIMRGLKEVRNNGHNVDFKILSAGYGLVDSSWTLLPYNVTFNNMRKNQILDWSAKLKIPGNVKNVLNTSYDLVFIALGENYLVSSGILEIAAFRNKTVILCGEKYADKFQLPNVYVIVANQSLCAKFACGNIGLKGEIVRKLLSRLANKSSGYFCVEKDLSI